MTDFMRRLLWAAADEGAGAAGGTGDGTGAAGATGGIRDGATGAAGAGGTGDAAAGTGDTSGAAGGGAGEGTGDGGTQDTGWRDQIEDEKAREVAGRFNSLTDLAKSVRELQSERDKLKNNALVPPGEDASEEEVKAFREKMGVPESPDGYDFLKPAEGEELSEYEKQSREAWMNRFHEIGVPKDQAQKIIEAWRSDMAEAHEAVQQADTKFAEDTEKALKQEWGEDFDQNKKIASSAAKELFGEDLEEMNQAQTRDGRLLMDHPAMVKMLARVGREMQEGSMGAMTEDAKETLEEQANEARTKRNEAMQRGDRETAAKWDEKEREILGKLGGSGPIVGSQGRTA